MSDTQGGYMLTALSWLGRGILLRGLALGHVCSG